MKGNCENVICQICKKEMSFGRIKRHIKSRHKEISLKEYLKKYYQTLPLHQPCIICKENIVYKYQTCSKECHGVLISSKLEGIPKTEGFMNTEHKSKISKYMMGKPGGFTGYTHSDLTKKIQSETIKKTKPHLGHKHTPETIAKIFDKRKLNKLEKFVANLLKESNIEFKSQYFLSKGKNCKCYDFKLKDKNVLIEIDGDYYHGNPKIKKHFWKVKEIKKNDKFKNRFAKDNGFKLLRFWESEVNSNPIKVINEIKKHT